MPMIVEIYSLTHLATISLFCSFIAMVLDAIEKFKHSFDFLNRDNIISWLVTGLMGITCILSFSIIWMSWSLVSKIEYPTLVDEEDSTVKEPEGNGLPQNTFSC